MFRTIFAKVVALFLDFGEGHSGQQAQLRRNVSWPPWGHPGGGGLRANPSSLPGEALAHGENP